MNVLLCHNFYRTSSPSGEDLAYGNEKKMLADHGVELTVFEKFNDDIDESSFAKKIRIGVDTIWSRKTYAAIVEVIERKRPDVAHFHNTFPQISPSAYKACYDCGVPVVQTIHNYRLVCPSALLLRDGRPCELCISNSLVSAVRYKCYRSSRSATSVIAAMLVYNRARKSYANYVDRYIALTNFAAARLQAGGLPADRILIKPNFLPQTVNPASGPRRNFAVYVGRLSEEKGVRTLVQAWRDVQGIALKVIGDGPLRSELELYANESKLNIEFTGHLGANEVLDWIKESRLLIIPSECYENFPLVVLEAYATCTPIAASNIGSLAEVVKDHETGLLFEPGNRKDLAEKVNFLAANRSNADLAAAGRDIFDEKYTAARSFERLMDIYNTILGQ